MRAPGLLRSLVLPAVATAAVACGGHNPPEFDAPPVLANREEITEAMRSVGAGLDTRVVLFLRIDDRGYVRDARVSKTSGSDQLDDAALWIAERMRFEPARRDGRAVAAAVEIPVTFDVVRPGVRAARLINADAVKEVMARDYGDLRGQIRVRAYVLLDGWAGEIRPGRTSDDRIADAARELVEMMRFQPAYKGSTALASWVILTLDFAGEESRVRIEESET
jgi:TonB family protein